MCSRWQFGAKARYPVIKDGNNKRSNASRQM